MKSIAISSFKANALKIIDQISKDHEKLVITKRGKPIVEVVPYKAEIEKAIPGKLRNTLIYEKDILSPLDEEMWDVNK